MADDINLLPFKSLHYAGTAPGIRLVVTGAVHGNETCGTRGIERVCAELDGGALRIGAGSVTFVPVCNPKANALKRRNGDRNLNRALAPTPEPREFEDQVANWLCPLLARHDVLLDLHSFQGGGQPFVMVGPRNNDGPLEPFAQANREEALARVLGVGRAVDGWLDTYADGVARRRARAQTEGRPSGIEQHPRYGVGTTEFMRSTGGAALTLECGQHDAPEAPEVAYTAIRRTLAHLGLTGEPAPPLAATMESLSLVQVVDKRHADDAFDRAWRSFDPIRQGDLIGRHRDGTESRAPFDGWIVFPNAKAEAHQEWYYLARASQRFA
ncbi:MAG: succinylglutamate desuccinylase/aspartoacylase family protein [Aquabacterium sp.]